MEIIFEYIGKILFYAGGISGVAFLLFRILGTKWLDEKFSKRLEEFKRFQNQQFEEYRFKINSLFNRISKIQEKEFEVLPMAWQKLQEANGAIGSISSPLQTYPDLNNYTKHELKEFINDSELKEFEKIELTQESDKTEYYKNKRFQYQSFKAGNILQEFHNFILLNKIFLEKDLFQLFTKIDGILFEIRLLCEDKNEIGFSLKLSENIRERNRKVSPMISKAEKIIQKRLHFNEA